MAEKRTVLRDQVVALRDLEARIGARLHEDLDAFRDYPEVHALLSSAIEGADKRSAALSQYLNGSESRSADNKHVVAVQEKTTAPAAILEQRVIDFGHAVTAYTILTELAFRLYEPPLRDLGPKHLKAYVSLLYAALRLMPAVVAQTLAVQELFCQCVCPMCGLGACACIQVGRQHVETAWRDAVGAATTTEGFRLHPPRPGSPLGMAGVQGADVLIAVDGQPATTVADIQAAIRKHAIGDNVGLVIQRSGEPPRDITVPHTSDNPK